VACSLAETRVEGAIYRIARKPNPWEWPDWQYVGDDGNRWDDPRKVYRVLYAGTSILGCFLEVLARFRPNPKLIEAFEGIEENDTDLPETERPGTLPQEWLNERRLAEVLGTEGTFAAVGQAESLSCLNLELADLCRAHGFEELDGAAIRQKAPRALTQAISTHVHQAVARDGKQFAGIYYLSRWGDDISNFALFEGDDRWQVREVRFPELGDHVDEFHKALEMHGIELRSA
jgi:hypothetical protein